MRGIRRNIEVLLFGLGVGFLCYMHNVSLTGMWIDAEIKFLKKWRDVSSWVLSCRSYMQSKKQILATLQTKERRIQFLENLLSEQEETQRENQRLKRATKFSDTATRLTARVLRIAKYKGHLSFVVGIPPTQSVEIYDVVMGDGCLIGRVTQCGFLGAYVLSVTDPHFRIPVVFEKSQIQAIVVGNRSKYLSILHTNQPESGIIPEEHVMTSGTDGLMPPGLFIGKAYITEKGNACVSTHQQIPDYVTVLKNAQSFF